MKNIKGLRYIIRKSLLENSNYIETDEALILKRTPEDNKLAIQSDLPGERDASSETFKNKEKIKKPGIFKWDTKFNAWTTSETNFKQAQELLNSINKTEFFIDKLEDIEQMVIASDAPNKNNLSDKIKIFINDLANATEEAAADAKIKQYLNFFSKFRKHSFTNSFLIFIQNPNATHVAGFGQWRDKLHRSVKKGAKGITIYAPIIKKNKDDNGNPTIDGDDRQIISIFKPVYVFDIADTEAIDERGETPETPQWFDDNTPNETADELTKYTEIVLQELGINLTTLDAKGGEKGYSAGGHINLTSDIAGVGKLSTLIHELAHELMHHRKSSPFYDEENNKQSRESKELQAESVSYTVLRNYNIPVKHHATYLALWKGNKDKIKSNMQFIINVSKFIIDRIDKVAEGFKNVQH